MAFLSQFQWPVVCVCAIDNDDDGGSGDGGDGGEVLR